MDIESSLPAFMFGATENLGEAFRTTGNMSSMQAGASMVTKDNVRAFDNYVRSKIGSLIKWNKKFNKRKETDGDFEAQPLGSSSLVAKELRGAALDQMWNSLPPEDKVMFDRYGVMEDILEARDIPRDRLKPRTEAEAAVQQYEEAAAAAAQAESGLTQAKTQKLTSDAAMTDAEREALIAKFPTEMQETAAGILNTQANTQAVGDQTRISAVDTAMKSVLPAVAGQPGGENGQ